MVLNIAVLTDDAEDEFHWREELQAALEGVPSVHLGRDAEAAQVVLIDGTSDEKLRGLDFKLASFDRQGKAVFLIVAEDSEVPHALLDGRVDELLVHPFRTLDLVSKFHHLQRITDSHELSGMHESFSRSLARLRDDLVLAESLQKSQLPARFPDVRGFQAKSRYLAGMRSGGDHFDLAESKDGSSISALLSDSSSYGLSSAVLSVLMRVAVKLSAEQVRSSRETVGRIYEELSMTLKEKDKLSLFYGVISRKDCRLRYLNLGSSGAFYSRPGRGFEVLPAQGGPITKSSGIPLHAETEIFLGPDDRLALISDGFVETVGGPEKVCELLNRFRKTDPTDALNELVYQVKSRFVEADDMPEQDCTAVILDVDSRMLRLAQG